VPAHPAADNCPGILALHPARDGHVARIRLPGGFAGGTQWAALAALAAGDGDGVLDLTARGNVQLRGLAPAAAGVLARRAAAAGLLPSAAHDRSRNITASPLSGLSGRPGLRRLVRALDAAIVADPALAALPGRFLVAVDDGSGGAGLAGCDTGLLRNGRQAELIVAGRLTGVRLPAAAAAAAVITAARCAVRCGAGTSVTRVTDLADGGAAVAAAAGGTLGPRAAAREDRLPLGAAGGPGSRYLIAAAPLGRVSAVQAALLARLLRRGEVLRLGTAGRIVLPHGAGPEAALGELAGAGLIVSDADDLAGVTACSGLACVRAVADVRSAASPLPGHPRTHWAACPRGCGRPPDAELVVATGPASFELAAESGAARRLPLLARVS
jgi:precorrin-3B synthase